MNPVISIKNLNFKYGKTAILEDVSFNVDRGDYLALAGPNGAGKTTLIRLLLGLEKSSGRIEILKTPLNKFSNWEKVGYLPQRAAVFNPLFPATVEETISLGILSSKRFPKKFSAKDKRKIKEMLEILDIIQLKDRLISGLSGGQQQKVFLARALISNPEILILDEPGSGLDSKSRENFFNLLKKVNKERETAIILITHDASEIGRYADKLLYLDKKIIFYGQFSDFCKSKEMEKYFGQFSQHLICHQH